MVGNRNAKEKELTSALLGLTVILEDSFVRARWWIDLLYLLFPFQMTACNLNESKEEIKLTVESMGGH